MKSPFTIIVQKYGGSSVATSEKIKGVAGLIKARVDKGERLCVVVSAMGKTTDQLLALAHDISKNPSRRELDMLLSCGERSSMALLAMALEEIGCQAVSLTGSQSGIITDDVHSGAKILELRPERVLLELSLGKVVIVAGFQGISTKREITTLGRGGSDATAVALAAALFADACEIYSDVEGVLTADPKWVEGATLLRQVGVAEMEELSLFGAKVMHAQALQLARAAGIHIRALKSGSSDEKGTLISPESVHKSLSQVMIAGKDRVYHLSVSGWDNLSQLLDQLLERKINHVQLYGWSGSGQNAWHCLIHPEDAHGFEEWVTTISVATRKPDASTVSLVGVGLCETPRVTSVAMKALRNAGFEIFGMLTAPNRCTFVLQQGKAQEASKYLHECVKVFSL